MLHNPTSAATSSRPDAEEANVQPTSRPVLEVRGYRLRAADRHLLTLLCEHQVLTTGQLVRLAGMPERTVQHRLGVLYPAGLVSRYRPRVAVGTSPYHVWLTAFGAEAIGTRPPEPWGEDPASVRTVAALSELWLDLRDHGPEVGITLTGWRRLPNGLSYADPRTGADRRLGADAELSARLGGTEVRALLFARIDRIPPNRLGPVLTRWSAYLAAAASATSPGLLIAGLVLTRTERRRMTVLDAASGVAGATERVAVAAVEPSAGALAADAVWRTAADPHDRRLADVLACVAEAGR
ncbi:MAG: replication-relaxation family protein [Actinomycetota bacterium]|nr:replication-relaxation family protein [Actinomycetota bacterium]